MSTTTTLNHVAIQCSAKKTSSIFFTKILKIPKSRSFTVNEELSSRIFGLNESVEIDVYENEKIRFEVFIKPKSNNPEFEHVCIEVENINDFFEICKSYKLEPFTVKKGEKDLYFVRDFSENLYEVKEKIRN